MADIIHIEEHLSRSPRRMPTDVVIGGKAEILLFTGIRYERLTSVEHLELGAPAQQGKKH